MVNVGVITKFINVNIQRKYLWKGLDIDEMRMWEWIVDSIFENEISR